MQQYDNDYKLTCSTDDPQLNHLKLFSDHKQASSSSEMRWSGLDIIQVTSQRKISSQILGIHLLLS